MPKSRGRAKSKSLAKSKQITTPQKNLQASLSDALRAIVNHPVASLIGLVAAVGGIAELVHQAVLYPDIFAEKEADVSSPFALPFSVKNNSLIFSMTNSSMVCYIDKVLTKNGSSFSKFAVVSALTTTIKPKDNAAFRCLLAGNAGQRSVFHIPQNDVLSAHIILRVEYTILGIPRVSPGTQFTWYTAATPPRWIAGNIVE